jgi:hypothetical protein
MTEIRNVHKKKMHLIYTETPSADQIVTIRYEPLRSGRLININFENHLRWLGESSSAHSSAECHLKLATIKTIFCQRFSTQIVVWKARGALKEKLAD